MRIIEISAKCSDLCYSAYIVNGKTVVENDGYPVDIKGLSGGDYITLKLDADTGKIVDWEVPTHEQVLLSFLEEGDDQEENEDDEDDGMILRGDILVERESDIVDLKKDSTFNDFPDGWVRTTKDRWKK